MEREMLIEGMKCAHCKARVEKALKEVPGVTGAEVDLETKTARVVTECSVTDAALTEAVRTAASLNPPSPVARKIRFCIASTLGLSHQGSTFKTPRTPCAAHTFPHSRYIFLIPHHFNIYFK